MHVLSFASVVDIDLSLLAPERVRPLRRSEYDHMVALGMFDEERIELLCGILVAMSPQGAPHANIAARLGNLLTLALGDASWVRVHSPLALSDESEPEPDVAVVAPGDYSIDHPTRALLVVEVADSSLRKDQKIKAGLYARAGIPEYWIVNVQDRSVEMYREPRDGQYATVESRGPGDVLSPIELGGVKVAVSDFLPA